MFLLAQTFTDRVVAFLLNKLESNNEKVRVGTLAIMRHLINSSGNVQFDNISEIRKFNLFTSQLRQLLLCLLI